MEEKVLTEFELTQKFCELSQEKSRLKEALEVIQKSLNEAEHELIEQLTAQEKTSTATYDGLGYATLCKPQVRASYQKDPETEKNLFGYLEAEGRKDLIKTVVDSRSLSTLVREKLEAGKQVPECIQYYLQSSIRVYDANGKWVA